MPLTTIEPPLWSLIYVVGSLTNSAPPLLMVTAASKSVSPESSLSVTLPLIVVLAVRALPPVS